jgi:uncharacterized integral membrane protein
MADESRSGQQQQGRGVQPALIGAAVLVVVLLDFVFQNTVEVPIHFLVFTTSQPLWLLLVITSAIAVAAAEVIAFIIRRRR